MQKNKTGLTEAEITLLQRVFAKFPEVEKALLFGSRAMGNFRPNSDADIAVSGKELSEKTIEQIIDELIEETNFPYLPDVVKLEKIQNEKLLQHIKKFGIIIYKK